MFFGALAGIGIGILMTHTYWSVRYTAAVVLFSSIAAYGSIHVML